MVDSFLIKKHPLIRRGFKQTFAYEGTRARYRPPWPGYYKCVCSFVQKLSRLLSYAVYDTPALYYFMGSGRTPL